MIVSEEMYQLGTKKSSIRELFEYGKQRAQIVGSENVYDFSIGNPTVPPPECIHKELQELMNTMTSVQLHGYTSAQGDFDTRQAISQYINKTYHTNFSANDFYITLGAAAALSLCFKALTKSFEDEFIAIAPFFPEYKTFVGGAGAKLKIVPPDTKEFQINFQALEATINQHTRGVIINSPNNPSGAVYTENTLIQLADLLRKKSEEYQTHIFLISDEPYREIVYDDICVPFVTKYYNDTLVCYSFSKSLSLPGERIGYVLVSNDAYENNNLYAAICGAGRALGYVCAPSIFQKVITKCMGQTGNIDEYKRNRDLLYKGLSDLGYECIKPDGAFYMFVKALEQSSDAFCEKAKEEDLLLVSASEFECDGYVRISYCVDHDMIERSFKAFERLKQKYTEQ